MDAPAMVRTSSQREASASNGSKAHGPSSSAGRMRSSLNAIRGGERAKKTLVAGETIDDYLAIAEPWFRSLQPLSPAEDEILFDIVDAKVREGRIAAAEKRLLDAAIEEEVAATREFKRLRIEKTAVVALRAMKQTLETAGVGRISALPLLVGPLRQTADMAEAAENLSDAPVHGLLQMVELVGSLSTWSQPNWPTELVRQLDSMTALAIEDLEVRTKVDELTVAQLRIELAQNGVPKNDPKMRRLAAYRRDLERQMEHHLSILEQLHRLRPSHQDSGSFARPIHINLKGVQPARA